MEFLSSFVDKFFSNPGALHSIVGHFPIVTLIIAPLFIVLGLIIKSMRQSFYISALILLIIGVVSTFTAVYTGELDSENIAAPQNFTTAISETLTEHAELAHQTRFIFTLLIIAFLLFVIASKRWPMKEGIHQALVIPYLCLYIISLGVLINTAHHGATLVHQYGLHSGYFKQESFQQIPQQ